MIPLFPLILLGRFRKHKTRFRLADSYNICLWYYNTDNFAIIIFEYNFSIYGANLLHFYVFNLEIARVSAQFEKSNNLFGTLPRTIILSLNFGFPTTNAVDDNCRRRSRSNRCVASVVFVVFSNCPAALICFACRSSSTTMISFGLLVVRSF